MMWFILLLIIGFSALSLVADNPKQEEEEVLFYDAHVISYLRDKYGEGLGLPDEEDYL
jgi:hypothetical protein